jgi:hypothetical protein
MKISEEEFAAGGWKRGDKKGEVIMLIAYPIRDHGTVP